MSHFEEQDSTHLKQAIAACCANNIGDLLDFEPQILRAFIPVPDFFALFTQERDDILHHILRLDDGEAYTEFFEIGISMAIAQSQSVVMLKHYGHFVQEKHICMAKAPFDFDFFMELTQHTTLKRLQSVNANSALCAFFEMVQQHKTLQQVAQSPRSAHVKKI